MRCQTGGPQIGEMWRQFTNFRPSSSVVLSHHQLTMSTEHLLGDVGGILERLIGVDNQQRQQ